MKLPTKRQQQLLQQLQDYLAAHGRPPTRAELASALGLRSPNAVQQQLQALARKGWLVLEPGVNRNIRLLTEPITASAPEATPEAALEAATAPAASLPLVGRVTAGAPTLADQHLEGYHRIDPDLFQPRADYLLRVRGLSLRDAGILEGDWLAVHRTSEARHGQLVIARLGDEVTAKRLYIQRGRIRLCPENPDFAPIELDPAREGNVIEGLVVGVIRTGKL